MAWIRDARHPMQALEERFAIDLIDYDAYRYFQPEGFDVFSKAQGQGPWWESAVDHC
ncbi:hypothetical protein J7E36_13120 [Pseudomonas fluorescens]|nr:hypothetical protein [Pseudomonas fluorescens]